LRSRRTNITTVTFRSGQTKITLRAGIALGAGITLNTGVTFRTRQTKVALIAFIAFIAFELRPLTVLRPRRTRPHIQQSVSGTEIRNTSITGT
jgi:hypothetical protein